MQMAASLLIVEMASRCTKVVAVSMETLRRRFPKTKPRSPRLKAADALILAVNGRSPV
jgi:hypothetical protein